MEDWDFWCQLSHHAPFVHVPGIGAPTAKAWAPPSWAMPSMSITGRKPPEFWSSTSAAGALMNKRHPGLACRHAGQVEQENQQLQLEHAHLQAARAQLQDIQEQLQATRINCRIASAAVATSTDGDRPLAVRTRALAERSLQMLQQSRAVRGAQALRRLLDLAR